MKNAKIHLVYFSATGSTAKITTAIGSLIAPVEIKKHLLDHQTFRPLDIPQDELVIFGIPVFSGRVPAVIKPLLQQIKGNNTPAILLCTYGNRAFEDALVELQDIVENHGFITISAAAFVATHSIFPKIAKGRPDSIDMEQVRIFTEQSLKVLANLENSSKIEIEGNRPYRDIKPVPLYPKTKDACNLCGLCIRKCPVGAISPDDPGIIDQELCISCARCISVCSRNAKRFGGLLYWFASKSFHRKYNARQVAYCTYRT